ncbi:MAG: hypothetical protein FJY80_11105, partial [Candidatus Aminicenantes bacterium]|nr:hypothetical protein [Candidatus Aminicenantes bacterium]
YLAGWEPSQKSIWAIYLEKDRIRKLGRFGVANGTLTEIMADKKFGLDVELSPDGQYLAMTYDGNSKIPDIRTLTTEGKLRSILLPCLNFERFLAWSPDGSNILFSSQRTGQNALWRLEVQDGQAVGEPVFITNIDGSIAYPGMTKNGTFYYSTFNLVEDAYTAKIDFPSGKTLQPERKIESESFGRTTTPFFSTDGKLLAYFFRKNVSTGPNMYDTLKVKDLEYGTMKEIPLDFSAQPTFMQLPRWSRDGKFIHLLGAKSGQRGLVRFDVATGQSELIAKDQGIDAWSSDGTIVYIVDRGPLPPKLSEQQVKIIRKKLDSSESKILYQGAVGEMTSWVRLSPDENWLSFNSHRYGVDGSGSLKIIPADPEITLTERGGLSFPEGMSNWTHDGKGLIQRILIDRKSRSFKLVYVSKLDPKTSGVDLDIKIESANIAVHPDGKTVAYTGQSASQEFWVLENFLPKK